MNTLATVEQLANELLNKTFIIEVFNERNLNHQPKEFVLSKMGYTFAWINSKQIFGQCSYEKKEIRLSKPLCSVNLDKLDGRITDCLLHEIAHAITFDIFGHSVKAHGYAWQTICKTIGGDGKRCYDSSKINKPASKYTLTCPTCNDTVNAHRKLKRDTACSKCCNGVYNDAHKFIITKNY